MQKKPKAGHITELAVSEYRILEDPFEWNISFRKDENCEWMQWKISKSDWNPSMGVPKVLYVREEDLLLLDEVSTPMQCIAPMDVVSKAELRSENTH